MSLAARQPGREWATYFKHGVSKQTSSYLGQFTWQRVVG
jgi:hypothetical protein